MTPQDALAQKSVDKMLELDYFSKWMGIELIETRYHH